MLKGLISVEKQPVRGLLAFEWVVLGYGLLTLLYALMLHDKVQGLWDIIGLRVQAVVVILLSWGLYRIFPCRLTVFFRILAQLLLLGSWYPETFELNRFLPNLDHVFATWEQQLFGFQPALVFCKEYASPWVSELLTLGYESYYPLMGIVPLFYLFRRYDELPKAAFVIIGSFFVFYLVFLFLPAGGPQYYYPAAGIENIRQGIFPNIGTYFMGDYEGLPIPGWEDGLMYKTLQVMHAAGERPTAAFPSSHVGVSVVLLWLAWESRNRKLFWSLLPFGVLMFFATFYIQAHYAIDAIAGLLAGTLIYFGLRGVYLKLKKP